MLGAGAAPLDAVRVLQPMIDVSAGRLDGLRTHCATSAEITQQEIRTLEGKLIKLFSRQLVIKAKFTEKDMPSELRNVPSLSQWLQVVGLGQESIKMVCSKVQCVESLQEKSERELKILLGNAREEEHRRLCRAIHNLKKYMEILMRGGGSGGAAEPDMPLWWDSWDHHHLLRGSPRTYNRHMRASVPSEDALLHLPNGTTSGGCASLSHQYLMSPPNLPNRNSSSGKSVLPLPLSRSASSIAPQQTACTPPPSPHSPNIFLTTSISIQNTKGKAGTKFPTTPPANRKHQIGLTPPTNNDVPPLTKSKSHESQLGIKIDGDDETEIIHNQGPDTPGHGRSRLATEPGVPSSPLAPCSPIRSPPYRSIQSNIQYAQQPIESDDSLKSSNLTVPRSPRTPVSRGMCHLIAHRFTKTFKMMATCDYCEKQMFLGAGLRCKECKYKCHRDCETKVPPSCGLPPEFVDEFKRKLQVEKLDGAVFPMNNSPSSGRSPQHGGGILWNRTRKKTQNHQLNANVPIFAGGPDSSSNTSSCNSSTPSSPALVSTGAIPQTPHTPRTPHNAIALVQPNLPPPGPILTHNRQQFNFPADVKKWPPNETNTGVGSSGVAGTGDSEHTVSLSGSASEDSERTPGGRTDSIDGDALQRNESAKWPRQNSLSMKEWDIPYNELGLGVPVGTGRFGTVYRGNWHGDVAVKFLNMHNVDNKADLESFKLEVATFRKTRHENLVLFMGVCTEPTRLAIITSLCKGMTLYTHIHLRKDKFNMNKTTIVAQQISQGMGYLHARGIIHKDLKSKNIFLENGKVVITDFGLFSVTKLCFGNSSGDSIGIPAGWLCYLAPELVRGLRPQQTHHADDLPFSKASDVYAFGTVWYELLCGEWPFKGQPPEAVIWQVGKGVKQTLANLQASRDVKDILMLCWSYRVSERPDFSRLLSTLEKLPRKRLARSPSHPVHLSRSAESVF